MSMLSRYCRFVGLDEARVRERMALWRARDALALRLAVAADEAPAAPPPPPRPEPPDVLALLRRGLDDHRERLHALLAEAIRPELESLADAMLRLEGKR